jgi:hypothetical protein
MPDRFDSFWQEYSAFWKNRRVFKRYLLWMLLPGFAVPLVNGLFHVGNCQTPVARLRLLGLFAAMALGGIKR